MSKVRSEGRRKKMSDDRSPSLPQPLSDEQIESCREMVSGGVTVTLAVFLATVDRIRGELGFRAVASQDSTAGRIAELQMRYDAAFGVIEAGLKREEELERERDEWRAVACARDAAESEAIAAFDKNPEADNWLGWRTLPDSEGRQFDVTVQLVGGVTALDRIKELEGEVARLTALHKEHCGAAYCDDIEQPASPLEESGANARKRCKRCGATTDDEHVRNLCPNSDLPIGEVGDLEESEAKKE